MPQRTPTWVWVVAAATVGALLPAPILSYDAHAHFPWMLAWMMVAPITALIAVGMFFAGRYFVRRAERGRRKGEFTTETQRSQR